MEGAKVSEQSLTMTYPTQFRSFQWWSWQPIACVMLRKKWYRKNTQPHAKPSHEKYRT